MPGGRRLVAVLAALVVVVTAVVLELVLAGDGPDAAARASASSSASGRGPDGALREGGAGWRSDGETTGAWLQVDWSDTVEVDRIRLQRDPVAQPGIRSGYLSFGDGSQVQVRFPEATRTVVVPVTARAVTSVRFTVSAVDDGARSVGLRAIRVDDGAADDAEVATDAPADGDVAPAGTLSSSGGTSEIALAPLVDGTDDGVGSTATLTEPGGSWVQVDWSRPRELTTIAVAGAGGGGSTLASGTLVFADGSRLAIGAVLPDPDRPTVVSFMPRVTTSVRLVVDAVDGAGDLQLAELAAYQRGAPALGASGDGTTPTGPAPTDCAAAAPDGATGLVVLCPDNGGEVGDTAAVRVAAPAYATVTATVWPADVTAPLGDPVTGAPSADGTTTVELDLAALPAGPFTVHVVAAANGASVAETYLQLDHAGTPPAGERRTGPAGRSLVYAEEFDGPLSITRDGTGADYAAAKPVVDGVQDFGDAPFADPVEGLGTVGVDHDDYLRLSTLAAPAGTAYPEGRLVGGLLASARPGGSGFSAQYGYFEARMLAPAAPGTWPAFWMLPSPNLVTDQPYVAEVDAVELYGHNPTGACHTTHQYPDPEQAGVASCGERWTTARAALGWHTYGVDIEPSGITFFIDGAEVAQAPQVRGGDEPLFFLVDLALGGGWPVELSALQGRTDLYVDWIRVYV